jgi:hypothetical protein
MRICNPAGTGVSGKAVIVFATVYVMMVFAVLLQALMGVPLIP